jgi:hypothetical protein
MRQPNLGGQNIMTGKDHWEDVYQNKHSNEVSWYRPHL